MVGSILLKFNNDGIILNPSTPKGASVNVAPLSLYCERFTFDYNAAVYGAMINNYPFPIRLGGSWFEFCETITDDELRKRLVLCWTSSEVYDVVSTTVMDDTIRYVACILADLFLPDLNYLIRYLPNGKIVRLTSKRGETIHLRDYMTKFGYVYREDVVNRLRQLKY